MTNHKVTLNTFISFCEEVAKLLADGKTLSVEVKEFRKKRSLSQNAFQHSIYGQISKHLISKGRKDWTPEKTKFELKNHFLGCEDVETTDLITGEVKSMLVVRSSSKLDKGDAYQFTTEILCWAESIGLTIKIPVTCEHYKQMAEQNR
tara:strand:- start:904 stop:1347 length:444 start_codon:yes stop_codon:yes gene_type:complete